MEVAPGERYGILLQSAQAGLDSLLVQYVNMNSGAIWNTQHVRITVGELAVHQRTNILPGVVSPNPASDYISVTAKNGERVVITDVLGREVGRSVFTGQKLDIHSLPNGVYTLTLTSSQARFMVAR